MPSKRPIKRRKPAAARKEDRIAVQVSAAEKERLIAAATAHGQAVGSWLRMLGLAEAARLQRTGVLPDPRK